MLILRGPEQAVLSLVFSPDATKLYAVHQALGVHVWNLADRTMLPLDIQRMRVWAEFVLHPGGRWAFGTMSIPNNRSNLIDLAAGRSKTFRFAEPWGHVAISPDGKRLATIASPRTANVTAEHALCGSKMTATGPRFVWEVVPPRDTVPWQVAFADNDTLVTIDGAPGGGLGVRQIAIRSAEDGEVVASVAPPANDLRQLLGSPDGRWAVVRRGSALWVFDANDMKQRPVGVVGKDFGSFGAFDRFDRRAAAFHPSSAHLLLATGGPAVVAYDAATWKEARTWEWDVGPLTAAAVSPDGALAAAGGPGGSVVVWDWGL